MQFNCFLCQARLEVKQTKKGKPYLTCDDCGVQVFVRYPAGIDRLEKLSQRHISLTGDYVVCRACQVAVRNTSKNITNPLFGRRGLYCPSCEELLLEVNES